MDVIEFVDVEDTLRVALNAALPGLYGPGVKAYIKLPPSLDPVFLRIARTGGGQRDLVTDQPTIAIDAYAQRGGSPSDGDAVRLMNRVAAWMRGLERLGHVGGVPVYEVAQLSGPYDNPDPLSPKHSRCSGLFTVALRGATTTI